MPPCPYLFHVVCKKCREPCVKGIASLCANFSCGTIFAKAISIDASTGSNDAFLIFSDNDTWNISNSCNWRDYLYQLLFYDFCPRHSHFLCIGFELLSGQIVPLPFMPEVVQRVLKVLPFAAMQNVPFRIYSGDLSGRAMSEAIFLQIFWLIVLVGVGWQFAKLAEKKLVVQGG